MRFSTEKALQDYCLQILQRKGIPAQAEVWTKSGIRADLVTDDAVIEIKKVLTREAIWQASGQAQAYQRDLQRPLVWIVGQLPTDRAAQATARTIAQVVAQDGCRVSFIEEDPFWQDTRRNWLNFGSLRPISAETVTDLPRSSALVEVGKLLAVVLGLSVVAIASTTLRRSSLSAVRVDAPSADQTLPADLAPPLASAPIAPATPIASPANWPAVQVQFCHGQNAPANFRSQPALNPEFVIGTLQLGETVYPTGQQVQREGIVWSEAIAPSLYPNQVGWMAVCFLRGP